MLHCLNGGENYTLRMHTDYFLTNVQLDISVFYSYIFINGPYFMQRRQCPIYNGCLITIFNCGFSTLGTCAMRAYISTAGKQIGIIRAKQF